MCFLAAGSSIREAPGARARLPPRSPCPGSRRLHRVVHRLQDDLAVADEERFGALGPRRSRGIAGRQASGAFAKSRARATAPLREFFAGGFAGRWPRTAISVGVMSAWRHARAIALLPGTAAVVVPVIVLLAGEGPSIGWGLGGLRAALPLLVGSALIGLGLALWVWTLRLFIGIGKGTLAPWDPTRHLVTEGPYSRVRNPMITAVIAALIGEAALFGSPALLVWCALFVGINWVYFVLYEEPGLERRFGDDYRAYRRNVPRWIPRRRPSRSPPVRTAQPLKDPGGRPLDHSGRGGMNSRATDRLS